jgi:predicted transcriptional regulator
MRDLGATLTIRLTPRELRRLREHARAAGTTPSAVVRAALERALAEPEEGGPTLGELSRRWVGAIRSGRVPGGRSAREVLETWDPDRRG